MTATSVDEQRHAAGGVHDEVEDVLGRNVVRRDRQVAHHGREQDDLPRHTRAVAVLDPARGVAVPGQGEQHARARVEPRVEHGEGCGEHYGVHDLLGAREPEAAECESEGADLGRQLVPRDDHEQDRDRTDVEEEDAPDHGIRGLRDALGGLVRFSSGHRDDLGAEVAEDHDGDPVEHGGPAVGHEPVVGDVGDRPGGAGDDAQDVEGADAEEHDDRGDLDRGQPELRLAERAQTHEVREREHEHAAERECPVGNSGEPLVEDPADHDGLEGDDADPEVPVEPPDRESGPIAEAVPGVLHEGTDHRPVRGHLPQHAHHEDDEGSPDRVREQRGGAHAADHRARAHEQARADDAAEGDHGQMPRP